MLVDSIPFPRMGFLTKKLSTSIWINISPVLAFILFCFLLKSLFFIWNKIGVEGIHSKLV
jgi:hypothetical protein